MANIHHSKKTINLLPNNGKTFVDNFLDWALSIGRLVVILTELVALGAFITRFSLDSTLADLHTKIKQQQVYINFFKDDEVKYRNLQDRLATAKALTKTENASLQKFFFITAAIPTTVNLTSLTQENGTIEVDLSLTDPNLLTQFVNTVRKSDDFTSISIDKIEKQASSGIILATVTITESTK